MKAVKAESHVFYNRSESKGQVACRCVVSVSIFRVGNGR